ncbi:elongation factor G [uncultured Paludibaculum sp.]|uniref:elongation factor G n=1 Tax=uncultured Paludibaculum sp. TaxID=1765020 RepID=UPI002AAAB1CC|nr:elongation factor G [uncultured Paludibaculum sp.]
MKVYESTEVRNVALVGHGHSGKTSLAAGMLFTAGATNRLTRVDEGNTITDFDDEEINRKLTISTSLAAVEWKKKKLNVFDTPGFNLFMYDTKISMAAADAALVVVDGVSGVEVMTEKVWEYAEQYALPRAFMINKLDRERSDFGRALANIQEVFGRFCVPIYLPIGKERDFTGVVDVISMKAWTYTPDGDGQGKEIPIPASMADEAKAAHDALIEMIAEGKDELMEKFFENGTLPVEDIMGGLHDAVKDDKIFPVMCGSALRNIGTDLVMEFLQEFCPNPTEHPALKAMVGDHEEFKAITDKDHVTAYVFKTVADPFSGRLSFFKVCTGVLKNDINLVDMRSKSQERLAHISVPMGKTLQPVNELHAGDIGVVAKLKDVLTADTLCEKGDSIEYPKVQIPEPSIAYAIAAKSRNDEDRMGNSVAKILEEDQGLRFYRDTQTKDFLLAGSGGQHIEVIVSRLKKRYNVEVELRQPKIPYRETIRGFADVHGRHKKQTGGHGQFGDCRIKMEPLERGAGFEYVNNIFGGAVPRQFIPAIEKGILEAAARGYLAGFPVVDFRVTLYDGSYHDVDSSEMAFKIAGRKAFKLAMEQAKPTLLEPLMKVEVAAPVEFAGDLMSDMNGRRGRISGMDTKGGTQIIRAVVPMSEMLTYQNDLTSMTQGRASFSMEFSHYDYVPALNADKIVAAYKASATGEVEEDE